MSGAGGTSGPEVRIGDSDRDAAVSALGEHYAAGRLTKEEYDERSERAWAARTSSALWPLFADLPRPATARPSGPPRSGGASSDRGHGGWWASARLTPVLLVLVALVVLTHLPVFLLVVLAWFVLAKMHLFRGPHGHRHGRSFR